jgi:hypothetical protein
MENVVETKDVVLGNEKYRIKIIQDESPHSPREDDNLGTMICFHGRYDLGDKHDYNSNNYEGWEEMEKMIRKQENVCVILPLYLYDHSGITMNTSGFDCRWDSGQVGFIFVSKETVRKEYGVKRIDQKLIDKVTEILESEVKTYDQYLTGDVYGYEVHEVKTCNKGHEHETLIGSCWGYYGTLECLSEAESIVRHTQKEVV